MSRRANVVDIQDMPEHIKDYLFDRWRGNSNDSFQEFHVRGVGGLEDAVIAWIEEQGIKCADGTLVKYWW
jgi:hypothetical protein